MYTSGSTGNPKGVMHSFRSMTAAADGFLAEWTDKLPSDTRAISYLPLAHVFERSCVEVTSLLGGNQIFFVESIDTFLRDLKRARPHAFLSVPRLWVNFQQGILARLPQEKLTRLLRVPIVSWLVKRKILRGLGLDRAVMAGSGSAPLPPEVLQWWRDLGLELLEGYGMTENFCLSHTSRVGAARVGYVGTPMPGVESRLTAEGEVLVKSPSNMLGYFKEPELSREAFTEDGFLKTGDLGETDAAGRLKITGRVKELFKTSKGKYVAPAPIESQLLARGELEQACVSGANLAQPFALVVLAEHLRKSELGAAQKVEVTKLLQLHLTQLNAKLDPHEQLDKLIVMREEWTVDNGLLTPTLKLKRQAIEARYGPKVAEWFLLTENIVWVS